MRWSLGLVTAMCVLANSSIIRADPFEYAWQEVAPGVHVGIREDSPRVPVMGTTSFVVGGEGVVVLDGGGVPLMADRAIEKIRGVTDLPVTHVVVSHWHQDHNWGIRAYHDAWPGVEIVSHPYTREALLERNPAALENIRGSTVAERQLETVQGLIAENEANRAWLQRFVEDMDIIESEYKRIEPLYPTVTIERRMVIHSGERTIELLHLGKGNTAGDIVMWLPAERIVASGDLVVRPTPYGFGSHPAEWADTLRALNALDFRLLIPGHGELQRDAEYLDLLIETLESVAAQASAMVAEGIDEDAAVERMDFSAVEERFTGGDAFLAGRFNAWFKVPIARSAHRIARGERPE